MLTKAFWSAALLRRFGIRPLSNVFLIGASALALASPSLAQEVSLETAPPVVVRTVPVAGSTNVSPGLKEIRVTFSKPMQDESWSWSTWGEENYPDATGKPHYLEDARTCVLPVKLLPAHFYATWLNSDKFKNFQDSDGRPAVPYLLTFRTAESESAASAAATDSPASSSTAGSLRTGASPSANPDALLDENQKLVAGWTERTFRGFFDARSFDAWSEKERAELVARLLETLDGPKNREYYQAINSLGALRSTNALPSLLRIATDRAEQDCRDRWMAIRALGFIGEQSVVPELIHLAYYPNLNTRWWAQISLVRLTGNNLGGDWKAWGQWWNDRGGQPPFKPEQVKWYHDPTAYEPAKLAEGDQKFLTDLKARQ
jgi:RNA polymerase sigma-70 factor (ECF subfamily)